MLREPEGGRVSWSVSYRNGQTKAFTFPIRNTKFGSIKPPHSFPSYDPAQLKTQLLSHEPEYLKVNSLPVVKQGGASH